MKYWILIITYLWKNILNHWFENPLSFLTKIIITFLLTFLAFAFIGALRQTEKLLSDQLENADILTSIIQISPRVSQDKEVRLQESLYEEATLKKALKIQDVTFLRKPFIQAKTVANKRIPVAVSFAKPTFWKEEWGEFQRPVNYIIQPEGAPEIRKITMRGFPVEVLPVKMEPAFLKARNIDQLVLLPYPSGELLLKEGFSSQIIIRADSVPELEDSLSRIRAYLSAERVPHNIFSGLNLLRELENFSEIQKYVRLGLISLLILVIAIVLGNQAVLEFRQQQYHYALLRSFGVPYTLIVWNDLIEKILLAACGFSLAYYLLPLLKKVLGPYVPQLADFNLLLLTEDLLYIGGAVLLGVFLSWIFLAVTSKKQIGLVLS